MKAKVQIYRNDGETSRGYPVKLVISHLKKTRRKTISYASAFDWDENLNIPKPAHPDFEKLFGLIKDIEKKAVQGVFLNLENFDKAFAFLLDEEKKKSVLVRDYFLIDIKRQREVGRNGNADTYESTMNEFEKYAPGVKFTEVTPKLLERFKRFKLDQDLTHSTVKMYIAVLRALYNKAVRDPDVLLEDKKPFEGIMNGLRVKVRRRKNRYLSKKQLRKMAYPDEKRWETLTDCQQRAVKMSLLQFYLGGANLKDIYFLKQNQFYKNRVLMQRAKTEKFVEEFDLKVFPQTRELLDELSQPVDGYVFPWRKTHTGYRTWMRNHYDDLIEAQKKLKIKVKPVDQKLNSGVFRHTFQTIGKLKGLDPDLIRELVGHERNDIDTAYKDRFPEKIRDKAHARIIALKPNLK